MISPRKRRPAYANALIEARRSGHHPASVVVVYGFPWKVGDGVCRLGVKPGEALDMEWACVAGVDVEIWNRSRAACVADRDHVRKFGDEVIDCEMLRMAAQIARAAHDVSIVEGDRRYTISELAFAGRHREAVTKMIAWPAWWSEETQKKHEQNKLRRERAIIAWLDAKCAA